MSFSAAPTLARLKDFQRRTVDHVFQRMYLDANPAPRFLVADEVGLGKTLVARGVIARALEHLQHQVERVDFVYVCSNAAIAHQNIDRLNVLGTGGFALASRLTLLPTQVAGLRRNRVNFVSFTPGTTFDLRSRSGIRAERSLLYRMLREGPFDRKGLLHFLQCTVGRESWENAALHSTDTIDADLAASFLADVVQDAALRDRVDDCCARFHRYRETPPADANEVRYALVGELRQRLARVCLNALEPDLVILDEFQRFRNLLQEDDPTAELAQDLFRYPEVRVLLLSATPYKMLSLDHEQHDDHYPDFLRTLRFLFGSEAAVGTVEQSIEAFRRALLDLSAPPAIAAARDALGGRLRGVMCRTERVSRTARQDAMVAEPPRPAALQAGDLNHARLIDGASREVRAGDAIEYWKSVPYPVNVMKGYQLRKELEALSTERLAAMATFIHTHGDALLRKDDFDRYRPIDPANARLRVLMDDSIERGLWRVLWMPPSLPAWQPEGPFQDLAGVTKALVFSAWNAVPDAIATLCSYEAERRAVAALGRTPRYGELADAFKPLLRFSRSADGRLTGMPVLLLQYPSPALASLIDPVALSLAAEPLPRLADLLAKVEGRVRQALVPLVRDRDTQGRVDQRWYWAALAWLDAQDYPGTGPWLHGWASDSEPDTDDTVTAFREHVEQFIHAQRDLDALGLGRPPDDLAAILARLALAGPAVCACRSLRRAAPDLPWDAPGLLSAAATIGAGFRTLFSVPESIAILRADDAEDAAERYWLLVLEHGLQGNLAALLDEQVHVLAEALGVADAPAPQRLGCIADELKESLSIRAAPLTLDELQPHPRLGTIDTTPFRLRCRFALRFGDLKDEQGQTRAETVRTAFNSPFRPFVLASTSVGQEGLDFHLWCHAVVHWNLPSNPVDLEQREGRVHRYKGHAVRKNVALALGRDTLRAHWTPGADPWGVLFDQARAVRGDDLRAFWLFETEGGARVERRVPLLPLSQDAAQLVRLKRGLALYRLVFGQPRQEDLLAHLGDRLSPTEIETAVAEWRIDLTPGSDA